MHLSAYASDSLILLERSQGKHDSQDFPSTSFLASIIMRPCLKIQPTYYDQEQHQLLDVLLLVVTASTPESRSMLWAGAIGLLQTGPHGIKPSASRVPRYYLIYDEIRQSCYALEQADLESIPPSVVYIHASSSMPYSKELR